jgi:hypothetical protein
VIISEHILLLESKKEETSSIKSKKFEKIKSCLIISLFINNIINSIKDDLSTVKVSKALTKLLIEYIIDSSVNIWESDISEIFLDINGIIGSVIVLKK